MDILNIIDNLDLEEPEQQNNRIMLDGGWSIHDEVFKIAIKNLGLDYSEFMDEPIEDREMILDYLEEKINDATR